MLEAIYPASHLGEMLRFSVFLTVLEWNRGPTSAQGGPTSAQGGPTRAQGRPTRAQGEPTRAQGGPTRAQGAPTSPCSLTSFGTWCGRSHLINSSPYIIICVYICVYIYMLYIYIHINVGFVPYVKAMFLNIRKHITNH